MEPLDPTTETSPPTPPEPPTPTLAGNPWELRAEEGFFGGLVGTVKGFITSPGGTFGETRRRGDLASPLLYAIIVGFISMAIASVWQMAMGTSWIDYVPPEVQEQWGLGASAMASTGAMIAWLILAPVFIVIGLFVGAAILHLCLMLVGGLKESESGFEGTLRALSYSHTSQLANLIPAVGGLIAFLWGLVLMVLGLMDLHRTSSVRAIIAIALPLILCCGCIVVAIMMGLAGLATAFGG